MTMNSEVYASHSVTYCKRNDVKDSHMDWTWEDKTYMQKLGGQDLLQKSGYKIKKETEKYL
jgi:hypothetical protein